MSRTERSSVWVPSDEALRAMINSSVRYQAAPLYRDVPPEYKDGNVTQYPIGSGIVFLSNYVRETINVGGRRITDVSLRGRARPMLPDQRIDQHQAGRAIDFMTRDKELGDAVANWLAVNADAIGVQCIVWCNRKFGPWFPRGDSRRFGEYVGSSPHVDHVHVDLTVEGAEGRTPFFSGRQLPPPLPPRRQARGSRNHAGNTRPAPILDAAGGSSAATTYVVIGASIVGAVAIGGILYWRYSQ